MFFIKFLIRKNGKIIYLFITFGKYEKKLSNQKRKVGPIWID